MIVVTVYDGFVSEIRAYFLAYRFSKEKNDEFVLDLSLFYKGRDNIYHLDYLNIPPTNTYMHRGTLEQKIDDYGRITGKEIIIVCNGTELINAYDNYDKNKIYYIVNDSSAYDEFFKVYPRFFYRYLGADSISKELRDQISLSKQSTNVDAFKRSIDGVNSVGVHIRLRDFVRLGWIVEDDYNFYKAAIQWCREKLKSPHFYVFSDDIECAKKILGFANDLSYVKFTGNDIADLEEIFCLAACNNHILSKKSTYGLFAETLSSDKKRGITIIIEKMHLAQNAADKGYVEESFNGENSLYRMFESDRFVRLNEKEIDILALKYNSMKKRIVIATMQSFSRVDLFGMQLMAVLAAERGHIVSFIGDNAKISEEENAIDWTMKHVQEAVNDNGQSYHMEVYPHTYLNKTKEYLHFFEKLLQESKGKDLYVVTRKPYAIQNNSYLKKIHYIFIDVSDPYEREKHGLSENELEFMYNNADVIITFDRKKQDELRDTAKGKVFYIDINMCYPTFICEKHRRWYSDEAIGYQKQLWNRVVDIIESI